MNKTNTKKKWVAEKRNLSKVYSGVTGSRIRIRDAEGGALGYTAGGNTIYLAESHPIMDGLPANKQMMFREGVGAHEVLHIKLTDFMLNRRIIESYPIQEQRLFGELLNICEDPAIEHFASQMFGGRLLRSLKYTISHVYRTSKDINMAQDALSQYMMALIQFGDMGPIKGYFTHPEARQMFHKTAPIMLECIKEPEPIKRIELVQEIFELSRPLWEDYIKEQEQLQKLLEEFAKLGKSNQLGGDSRPSQTPRRSDKETKADRRRNITIRKVSKEELEEAKKDADAAEDMPDGDIEILVCDEDLEQESENSDSNVSIGINGGQQENLEESNDSDDSELDVDYEDLEGNNNSENAEELEEDEVDPSSDKASPDSDTDKTDENMTSDNESDGSQGEDNMASDKESDGSQGEPSSTDSSSMQSDNTQSQVPSSPNVDDEKVSDNNRSQNTSIPDTVYNEEPQDDFMDDEDYEVSSDEYEITEEDIQAIASEVERCLEDVEKEEEGNRENDDFPIDFPFTTNKLPNSQCVNYRVRINNPEALEGEYNAVVSHMKKGIRSTTRQLDQIFKKDIEEMERHVTGTINLNRLYQPIKSTRVFDRRRAPADKSDMAVFIAVDESGSMGGEKSRAAMQTCIALAEVFDKLKIPVYIMGYTTIHYSGAEHHHYITWRNTKKERMKLLNLHGRNRNFDSHSIRYGGEILKKKSAKHKLMIVISDGTPSAADYSRHGVNGVTDTRNAVRETRRFASVLGVAVQTSDNEALKHMYGKDFIRIQSVDELFKKISNTMRRIVRSWE